MASLPSKFQNQKPRQEWPDNSPGSAKNSATLGIKRKKYIPSHARVPRDLINILLQQGAHHPHGTFPLLRLRRRGRKGEEAHSKIPNSFMLRRRIQIIFPSVEVSYHVRPNRRVRIIRGVRNQLISELLRVPCKGNCRPDRQPPQRRIRCGICPTHPRHRDALRPHQHPQRSPRRPADGCFCRTRLERKYTN
jgi:hypothetical protein